MNPLLSVLGLLSPVKSCEALSYSLFLFLPYQIALDYVVHGRREERLEGMLRRAPKTLELSSATLVRTCSERVLSHKVPAENFQ